MKLANELAALAMEHTWERLRPGMKESEVGAIFEGFVHGHGVGYKGKVEMARAFTLVWSGPGIRTFTATGDRPVQEHEPTLFEIWVCVDGYWNDLTKNLCPGELTPEYHKLLDLLLAVFNEAAAFAKHGASLPELDRLVRARIAEGGYPGTAVASRYATVWELAPTSRHMRTRRAPGPFTKAWCWRLSRQSIGRAAAACGWKTTSGSPATATRSCARFPTISGCCNGPMPERPHTDGDRRQSRSI